MLLQETVENLQSFAALVKEIHFEGNEKISRLMTYYLEQNISLINEIILVSLSQLQKLKKNASDNDVICTQAKLTNLINQKLALSTQQFLNVSLGQIADYNEWLKAHCDLATD